MTDNAIIFKVSTDGDDASPEGPFRTLGAARDALRRKQPLPCPAIVEIEVGHYRLEDSLTFEAVDSGTSDTPITWRAAPGEAVRILGGRFLDPTRWLPVTDVEVLDRLDPAARQHVRQCDLRAQGISDFGAFGSRGFGRGIVGAPLELFIDDQPMDLAQWPAPGTFTTITGFTKTMTNEWGFPNGDLAGGFTYDGDRPKHWAANDDLWVHGYWAYDWANSYERVARLDVATRTVETAAPHGHFHFATGQRFYFLNILEEVTAPGRWYLDRARGILYVWPNGDLSKLESLVSELRAPLLSFNDVSHVRIEGLIIEGGRGSGISIIGGSDLRISSCTIRNLGNWGIVVRGGRDHIISGCHVYGTGDGGISIHGGDRPTLTPCNHTVVGTHIHHIARWTRTYVAGIEADGVGMRLAENHIHDAPHTAIMFWGNDILIEGNDIHRVCLETGDAGAIYTGRDYTYRGNVIRDNRIHDLGGYGLGGTMAIYMDDCVSGTTITGNLIWNCHFGIYLGGGRDFRVSGNIVVDCHIPLHSDARGVNRNPVWRNMVNVVMRGRLKSMRHDHPPYSSRYPDISTVDQHYALGNGVPAENNRIEQNIIVASKSPIRIETPGAEFHQNLYWCADGPVQFLSGSATTWTSQTYEVNFKGEAPRYQALGQVPRIPGEPDGESWNQATRITTFINQVDDKVTNSIDLRFLRQDDTLLIRCHIRRLPLHQRMSGVIWLREHFELFLQPHAGGPGMVQIGLASDGEYEVVWHGCRHPDGYQISAVATITDDGWLAELHVPLAPLAHAAGWSADLASAPWTYFAACIIPAEFLEWTEWQASGHDQTGLVADPRFANSAGRDFQLLPDSPAHSFRAFSSPPGMDLHHV